MEKQLNQLIENLKKAMIADMRAGKMILNANVRKRKTHAELQYAREELDSFKRENNF